MEPFVEIGECKLSRDIVDEVDTWVSAAGHAIFDGSRDSRLGMGAILRGLAWEEATGS